MNPADPPGPGPGPGPDGTAGRRLAQLAELSVEVLKGAGRSTVADLEQLGIGSVLDLITHYPRRYIDGTRLVPLADIAVGDTASVLAEVRSVRQPAGRPGRGRGRPASRVEIEVTDASGAGLTAVFFNQSWRARQLPAGTQALLYGTVDTFRDRRQMVNPRVEVLESAGEEPDSGGAPEAGRVFAIYPLSDKISLTSGRLTRLVGEALDRAKVFADPVPLAWRRQIGLVDRTAAFNHIHRPSSWEETEPARRRLAFDELFRLQLALVLRKQRQEEDARGIQHVIDRPDGPTLVERFLAGLPFEPTGAQRRVIDTIRADLAGPLPMHRLLQGDVGAGKTVVAVAAMLVAVDGGHQGALMAPTEVLAEQHASGVTQLLEGLTVPDPSTLGGDRPLRVALLTSRTPAGERASLHADLDRGAVDLLIGTHALLTDEVRFRSLGVVVIDEQHRFGVEQRAALRAKGRGEDGGGRDPDVLVMTATPIPRTAAMVVFGDLDLSIVDELPPGRAPVETTWARTDEQVAVAWSAVRREVAAGHRAFVVCPLVEGSDRIEARSATEEAARLAEGELAGLRVGLLHGQMRPADKETVMTEFRNGAVEVLVATTVIEVGVDVPEATVMVIEDADRFGIAQLHQLRGRVGRGTDPSWCYLLSASESPEAETRLSAMQRTTDGFELADVDLRLRGAGTILGARQQGRSDLKLAKLLDDRDLVIEARRLARSMVDEDPGLTDQPLLSDELQRFVEPEEAAFLFKN